MPRYQDVNATLKSHIATLRVMLSIAVLMILLMWIGWQQAKQAVRIHIPPDIRSGAVVKADDINPANVYAFASYIFQQGNHWHQDGDQDYGKQIFRLSAFLTPPFREHLTADMILRGRQGELSGRTRIIQELPGHGFEERRVALLDRNSWIVWLDVNIQEYVRGMEVKNVNIRYPLRVVRYDVNPETNPWGLALDGFAGDGPRRLSEEEANPDNNKIESVLNVDVDSQTP